MPPLPPPQIEESRRPNQGPPLPTPDPIDYERFKELLQDPSENDRLVTIHEALAPYKPLFEDQTVLDFGASFGTSTVALLDLGARRVVGVEPDRERVERGQELLKASGFGDTVELIYVADTRRMPFDDGAFPFILANAVIEHIPQPRGEFMKEIWRVLAPGGHLVINETPNKYLPLERHTTGLWFNHWLPERTAYRRAIRRGRFKPERDDWRGSGWRGLGYWEMVESLEGYDLVPERLTPKHKLLNALRLPASLLDPYPTWVLRKR